jgi:hypothetical protein
MPARRKPKGLRVRWRTLLGKSDKWKVDVDDVMEESKNVGAGIRNDEDLY